MKIKVVYGSKKKKDTKRPNCYREERLITSYFIYNYYIEKVLRVFFLHKGTYNMYSKFQYKSAQ